jgi:hypothetical protein
LNKDPSREDFRVPDLQPLPGFTVERLENRKRLLADVDMYRRDLDRELNIRQLYASREQAFTVVTSAATREAFDLSKEPAKLRERYSLPQSSRSLPGQHFGVSMLLARRLVETGVRFVQVNLGGLNHWDFHDAEDRYLKERIPSFDIGFSALLNDLHQRGLLDDTLVVCTGEMGRNPRLGAPTAGGTPGVPDGRNHWQWCWTVLFAGAGVRGGTAVGASDEVGGYPDGRAYYPSDLGATVYHTLGIPPEAEVKDLEDRPIVVNEGEVISDLF